MLHNLHIEPFILFSLIKHFTVKLRMNTVIQSRIHIMHVICIRIDIIEKAGWMNDIEY
jgi:hypothetical protein